MRVSSRAFWVPKAGNSIEEYEDAVAPTNPIKSEALEGFRCAIADGATEASFSAIWARQLTLQWVRQTGGLGCFFRSLPTLADEWQSEIGTELLPWYAEQKALSGAYSSLLGVRFKDRSESRRSRPHWEATAVGDSCLFQVREHNVVAKFPLTSSEDFNNRPILISSRMPNQAANDVRRACGECRSGDLFYLMTDALAHWFLRQVEADEPADTYIDDIARQKEFAGFVDHWRADRDADGKPLLRNDDVTLLRLQILS